MGSMYQKTEQYLLPHVYPIGSKLVQQEPVGEEKLRHDYHQVENFAQKENVGVSVVFVLQIVLESGEQSSHLLIRFFDDLPCCAFPQVFH